jgi:flagellar protein FliS
MQPGVRRYVAVSVETASPARIVVRLYEKAISCLREAEGAFARGDVTARSKALGRAHAIVSELRATLDHEPAPDLAARLEALYDFCLERIVGANQQASPAPLAPVVRVLDDLLDGWRAVA